ncbi:MAG TPA: hypothetical protein VHF06_00445 [Pseudonocardiaceae bacterium]|jgi:hypothetical protein|nr:hypothetical protein [Pseudonocardiaceae bacterium]
MNTMINLVSPGRLVSGGIRVSEGQAGLPYGGRQMSANPSCTWPNSVDFDLPKHVALLAGAPTDVQTTGVPPSAVKRRT